MRLSISHSTTTSFFIFVIYLLFLEIVLSCSLKVSVIRKFLFNFYYSFSIELFYFFIIFHIFISCFIILFVYYYKMTLPFCIKICMDFFAVFRFKNFEIIKSFCCSFNKFKKFVNFFELSAKKIIEILQKIL